MTFREQMLMLARKGGAATKRRYQNDPTHFQKLGALGGRASVAARKARLAAGEAGVVASRDDVPLGEPSTSIPATASITPYRPSDWVRRRLAIARECRAPAAPANTLADSPRREAGSEASRADTLRRPR